MKRLHSFASANYFIILFFFLGLFLTPSVFGQVSGIVFRDYNAKGQKDNTATFNESSASSIKVYADNASGVDLIDNDGSTWGANAVKAFTKENNPYDFGFKSAVCAVNITPSVSGCYQNGGASKATVSVEVSWADATVSVTANDASDAITVTFAGQTRSINPGAYTSTSGNGTIVSPQVVAFEVNADASTQTIQAFFGADYASSTCKNEHTGVILPAACPPLTCTGDQTGGQVFNDYNADGIKQAGETQGLLGVTVKSYDCNGVEVGSTTTDILGKYVFTSLTAASYPIRVEFSNLPRSVGSGGTLNGTNGRTTTQFVAAANCDVDLGVLDPNDYCQTNPKIIVPCFVYGDPLASGSISATRDALVTFDYGAYGVHGSNVHTISAADSIGTLWGMAYNKYNSKFYATATLKRHAGLGPMGLGGLYTINPITDAITGFDLTTLGINVGTIPSNTARGLLPDPAQPSADSLAFEATGKVGIGDLDISEDGNFLYFINLFDKKLYKINITGATPTLVGSYTVPSSCSGGQGRPFGLKVYQGNIYVGAVCDGLSSQNKSNLRAYVYTFDTLATTFSQVFDFPLTYPKGAPFTLNVATRNFTGWYPWTDSFDQINTNTTPGGNQYRLIHPQPILTDIEFDIDGSMILGFGDRTGMQSGFKNYRPSGSDGNTYSAISGGDILRAVKNNTGNYVLENNAKVGATTGNGVNNNQGPGFGEFYNDDYYYATGSAGLLHSEVAFGALLLRPGSGEVTITCMDPIDVQSGGSGNTGGVRYLKNGTGQAAAGATMGLILYDGDTDVGVFSKATGLGDLEVACALPTYLQIGNYVWYDQDRDGVQDPCEAPLSNITVSLWKGGSQIASTTTNSSGAYYFSSKSNLSVSANWTGTDADTTLLPSTAYEIRIDTSNQTQLDTLKLTIANSIINNGNDQNDSDASVTGNYAVISFTTGAAGSTNHTLDFGFSPICDTTLVVTKTTICNGATVNLFAQVSGVKGALSYSINGTMWLALTNPTNVTPSLTTTYFVKDTLTGGCFDIDTLVITVNPTPTTPILTTPQNNVCPATTVNLTALAATLTPSVSGGVFEWRVSNSSSSALISNPTMVTNGVYYLFEKSPSDCYATAQAVTVAIQTCCPTPICMPVTVIRN